MSASANVCDFVLRGAGELVTMAGETGDADAGLAVMRRGALLARDGRVVWVGRETELTRAARRGRRTARASPTTRSSSTPRAPPCCPASSTAHTHAVFAGSRADEYVARLGRRVLRRDPRLAAAASTAPCAATRAASADELAALTRARLDCFLCHGTTTLEVKSGYGLTLADERKMLAAAAHRSPDTPRAHLPRCALRAARVRGTTATTTSTCVCDEMLPALARRGRVLRRLLRRRRLHRRAVAARAAAARASSATPSRSTPTSSARSGGTLLAAELGCVSADHLVHAGAAEIAALRAAGVVAVCLPGHQLHPGRALRAGARPSSRPG